MVCETIRKGMECTFMTAKGCSYKNGLCREIVEACKGCNRMVEFSAGWYCSAYPEPSLKWKNGHCSMASHVASAVSGNKTKINPLKASKRGKK